MRVAILGGGVSGVVLAQELSAAPGLELHLFENRPGLGGLQRTVACNGLNYDIGCFILPDRHDLFKSFPRLKDVFVAQEFRPQAVRESGRLDAYPLTMRGYAADFGRLRALAHLLAILPSKLLYFRKKRLTDYIRYYIGGGIYVNSGLKHYVERLYRLEDREIDIAFAAQRLQHLRSLSLRRQIGMRLRAVAARFGPGAPTPAVRQTTYVRPEAGFGSVYAEIENTLTARGVKVFTNARIRAIRRSGEGFHIDGEFYDRIVSTIPLPQLARYTGLAEPQGFECVDLVTLFYRFTGEPRFDSAVLFNYTRRGCWKRITLFSRYYGRAANGDGYFSLECVGGAEADELSLHRDFREHARALGLFTGTLSLEGSAITRDAYPVYRRADAGMLEETKARVRALGIDSLGRQGAFEFLSSAEAAAGSRRFSNAFLSGDSRAETKRA